MDEVEVLSDRIGIITNGSLKYLGTQFKLKRVYGKGFKLVINLNNKIGNDLINDKQLNERNEVIDSFIMNIYDHTKLAQ